MAGTPSSSVATGGITGVVAVGLPQLVYRYTVAGASKASIDTGADAAQAGDNVWTNGDVLEVFLAGFTAGAAVQDSVTVTVNNDGTGVYDRQFVQGANAAASAGVAVSQASWSLSFRGSGGVASGGSLALRIPGYAGAVVQKAADVTIAMPDSTGANESIIAYTLGWRSTAAITRIKFAGGGGNLGIGTTLLVYKRLAS